MSRREYAPGQHGLKKTKLSNFGVQLREKQKIKRIYGVLETQFRNYFLKATATKGVTGHIFCNSLERRLDSVLFNAGFAKSRTDGRQIVSHNHVSVNGRRVNIASFLVKPNDIIEIKTDDKVVGQYQDQCGDHQGTQGPGLVGSGCREFDDQGRACSDA